MFKYFYMNNDFQFNYKGECKHKGIALNTKSTDIEIPIGNVVKVFNKQHIGLYTHFRMNPFLIDYDNVEFFPVYSRVVRFKCGMLPLFKTPIEIGYGFNIIPGFSNFSVDIKGNVVSFQTGKILSIGTNAYGYPEVNIYDPDKEKWRGVALHILIARTYVKNPDPSNKIYVNHIDGNKNNFNVNNLEWVDAQENVTHAINNGLNISKKECTIHDLETEQSLEYENPFIGMKALNLNVNYQGKMRRVGNEVFPRVYKKRYVITDVGVTFNEMIKSLNGQSYNAVNRGPYQAYEIDTGNVVDCDEILDLVTVTGVPHHHVRGILESNTPKESSGFYFRNKTDLPFPKKFEKYIRLLKRSFEIICKNTGVGKTFDSLSELCKFLGTDKSTIYRRLKNNEPYKNWEIIELTKN